MAGSLVQVATTTISGATASVSLTGIDDDSVYMVAGFGIGVETNTREINLRITKSGTVQTDSEYDHAFYGLITAGGDHTEVYNTNQSFVRWDSDLGTGTSELSNFIIYLYNFNSSSQYSYGVVQETDVNHVQTALGKVGSFSHTVASASDGINIQGESSSNLLSGTMTLYKVV